MTADSMPPGTQISQRLHKVRKLQEQTASERRTDTQRRLIEAGRHIIATHGVGGTSVNLITSRAGFTRGAFYSNFTDMDHFVRMVIRSEWKRTLTRAYTALSESDEVGSRLAALTDYAPLNSPSIPDHVDSEKVIAGLQIATESFFDTLPSSPEPNGKELFVELATRILAALPQDRETLLLWTSISNYLVRCADPEHSTIAAFRNFRQGIDTFVAATLERLDLECKISASDLVDLIVTVGLRSVRNELIATDKATYELHSGDHSSSLTGRLFPVILPLLAAGYTEA